MPLLKLVRELLPILDWGRQYSRESFRADLIAGTIVVFITIPQVIAYALLAGVPPQAGLYAAMFALICYGLFGTSRTLAVGPAAIIAIMTLEAARNFAVPFSPEFIVVTSKLALVTGLLMIVLRVLNFGAVISFLSHAVVTAFISAAALLIIANQTPSILGLPTPSSTTIVSITTLIVESFDDINYTAIAISAFAIALLLFCRMFLERILLALGMSVLWAGSIVRSAPMFVVFFAVIIVAGFSLDETRAVAIVGQVPSELPRLALVHITLDELRDMLPSALLISMIVFMESMSISAAVASKRREKIEPNRELVGLGMANLGASIAGGFPVAGSFGRTAVNFSAGAVSPVSSIVTGVLVLLTIMVFTPLFFYLPKAALSAIIVISAAQLIEIHAIRKIFAFNPTDAVTFVFTFVAVLVLGVEMGILTGIVISFVLLIRASSKPHIAVVGRWGETEHFRNVLRHQVKTTPAVLAVRIDESLYFVNTRYIETFLLNRVAESPEIRHVLLICTATNFIDSAGLEMLERLSDNLAEVGVTLHMSEVKGPVMDRLKETDFYADMRGQVFFTTDIAMKELEQMDAPSA